MPLFNSGLKADTVFRVDSQAASPIPSFCLSSAKGHGGEPLSEKYWRRSHPGFHPLWIRLHWLRRFVNCAFSLRRRQLRNFFLVSFTEDFRNTRNLKPPRSRVCPQKFASN